MNVPAAPCKKQLPNLTSDGLPATLLGQPVITALLAIPILGENLAWIEVLGGFVVLGGIYLVHRSRTNAIDPQASG